MSSSSLCVGLTALLLASAASSPVAGAGHREPRLSGFASGGRPRIAAAHIDPAPGARAAPAYEIVAEYPHDPGAYTQGLFWHDGHLYEGTGRYGTSWLRRVDPGTGDVLQEVALAANLFGEGVALHGNRIFQLTWLSKRGFIYDAATFERVGEFRYETEGWGLTSDGDHLILSDGSDTLFFLDPADQHVVRTLAVRHDGAPLGDLNELEHIDGLIYANVWHSDFIYRIDPESGAVVDRIDLSDLAAGERPRDTEGVLNGIAHDPNTGHLFVTGKLWSKVFEVRLTIDEVRVP